MPITDDALTAWQEVARGDAARPTLARSGHAACALPPGHNQDVIIFGGYTEEGGTVRRPTNEAWVFSLRNGVWAPVKISGDARPRARLVSQSAVVDNTMYIIGGWDPGSKGDGGDILSDIWKLDLETYEWSEVQIQGDPLQPCSRHQAVALGSRIYIHTHRNTHDVLCLDTSTDPATLTSIAIDGPHGTPASRGLHSMTAVDGKLYIYGGAPKAGGMLGDLWELDPEAGRWVELDADGQTPHVRCSHAAARSGSCVTFFGGSYYREEGGLQALDDVFAYDVAQRSWKHAAAGPGTPRPRNAHSLTPLPDGRLLMYGGWKPFVESYNDTFVLDPDKLEWSSHIAGSAW